MDLKEFIRQSLLDISEGLHEANEEYKKGSKSGSNVFLLLPSGPKNDARGVKFDLAVTTKSESGTGGKAGINIKIVELSTGGQSQSAKENISRISFTVAINQAIG